MQHDGFEWINLTSTAVASIGALGAFLWAVFLYRGELRRRRELEALAAREQAALVAGWLKTVDRSVGELPIQARFYLHNGSKLPVYSATVCLIDKDGDVGMQEIGVLPPGETYESPGLFHRNEHDLPLASAPQAFWFTDTAGLRWFRDWEGSLHEWPESGDPSWWGPLLTKWKPSFAPDAAPAG